MKSMKLIGTFSLLLITAACGSGMPDYDATGTFETTEVLVSSEVSGKLLWLDVEEGTVLEAGQQVGVVDTVQLYLRKKQLEASVKSVEGQLPDILKQVAALKEEIATAEREKRRVENLLKAGAANQKQLDDAQAHLEVLQKQLVAQGSTLLNSRESLTWQSSSVGVQVAQVEDQLMKCHITSPIALVNEYSKEKRTVGFYADKLCLTPRYLNTVIHQVSHHTVMDWINQAVILEAQVLLKHSDLLIYQIADQLNFPNPSFFCKFFKRKTGMTPQEYQKK